MSLSYEVLDEKPVYQGFFNLTRFRLRHSLFAGGWSEPLTRELFHRGSCVAVLPYDPVTGQVVLIEQFRIGAVPHKNQPWLIETVAGAVEDGETPEAVAFREAEEEAGCRLQELIRIGEFYTSPGGCSEIVTVFCGLLGGDDIQQGVFGLEGEGEDIRAFAVSLDEALGWIETGVIDSVVPVLALQWLALNRQRLQDRV